MKSIIQAEKDCYFCHTTENLNQHHIIHGTANRKIADREGLWCYLCQTHHTGALGVHTHRDLDLILIKEAQRRYEEAHSRAEWMSLFSKNWLWDEE